MPLQKGDKKMTKVIFTYEGEKLFLSLTDDQLRLLNWLDKEDYFPYDTNIEVVETTDFKEI